MLKSIIKLSHIVCYTLPFMGISVMVYSEDITPKLDEISSKTRQNIRETKDIISKTQNKIKLMRSQNDVRTREIEGLTTKVTTIITKMSGQGQDNSALQSEILVLNELLNIERNTTEKLRKNNTKLAKNTVAIIEKHKKSFIQLASDYKVIIKKMRDLRASLSLEIKKHIKLKTKNKVLETKINKEKQNTRLVRANYKNRILENQSRISQLDNRIKVYEKLIKKKATSQKNIPKNK